MMTQAFDSLEEAVLMESDPLQGKIRTPDFFAPDGSLRVQWKTLCLASDLFPAVFARRRHRVHRAPITVRAKGVDVFFSGERFDQSDLDVLLAVLLLVAKNYSQTRSSTMSFSLNELLALLDRKTCCSGRDCLLQNLRRLADSRIEISDRSYSHYTRILDSIVYDHARQACLVELNTDLAKDFRECAGLAVFVRERLSLGRHPLAKWLHAILWTCPAQCRIDCRRLAALSGIHSDASEELVRTVGETLEGLRAAGLIVSWKQDGEFNVLVDRIGSQQEDAAAEERSSNG